LGGGGSGLGILLSGSGATISNNIVGTVAPGMNPSTGTAVDCILGSSPLFSHNDVWNNVAYNPAPPYGSGCGDPTGTEGNISLDPKFCGADLGDYGLQDFSPCLFEGEGSTNIGALQGRGCEAAATQPSSWGAVKQIFK
jgi:hypothetical protein